MKFILGTKLAMTQVFKEDGTVVPVTCVKAGPCVVTQVKKNNKNGSVFVQIGFGEQKKFRLNKPEQGHLKGLPAVSVMRELPVGGNDNLKRGDTFTVKIFKPGDKVRVIGKSKGKGFQGVVKRHGFGGSPASHGHKDQLRMPGSIGATDAARVFKGTRMAGRMGNKNVTVRNLEVVEVHPDENQLLIKGAVPGARGGLLIVSSDEGEIEVEIQEEKNNGSKSAEEESARNGARAADGHEADNKGGDSQIADETNTSGNNLKENNKEDKIEDTEAKSAEKKESKEEKV